MDRTNRSRFHAVMNGDSTVDRCPALEWATWWDKTIRFWEGEGLDKDLDGDALFRHFGLDRNTQFWFPHKSPGCPKDHSEGGGIITNEADYERVKPFLYPKDAVQRMKAQIESTLPGYESGETIVWYTLEGFFWFPRVLFGIENHFYSYYDHPELYHRICEDLLQWQIAVIDEFSAYMKADFMTIAEDMSYNHGPMVSRELFDEFMLPYYRRLIPEIKKHGTRVLIDSDGDISSAVSWFADAGIEGVLPLEHQAGVNLGEIRRQFPEFLMIGGFDKMAMLKSKEAIDAEFQRLLPVIRSGRFIPSMDHQTPPGTSLENYCYYVEKLKEYGNFSCHS